MSKVPLEEFVLAEPRGVECWRCGESDELVSLMKVYEQFDEIQTGKDEGAPAWKPDDSGWVCPKCRD